MITRDEIAVLVPARAGSKGVPNKNHRECAGRPLVDYTFQVIRDCGLSAQAFVTTDSEAVIDRARIFGINVPFVRPAHLAEDKTPMIEVVKHFFSHIEKTHEGERFKAIALLQPTSPLRSEKSLNEAIRLFLQHNPDSLVSIVEVPHCYKQVSLMRRDDAGFLSDLATGSAIIAKTGRQGEAPQWARNGPAIAIFKTSVLTTGSFYGQKTFGFQMPRLESIDIDDADDFVIAEALLAHKFTRG